MTEIWELKGINLELPVSFVGVWSDVPFDQMEIRETSRGIDDEYFGEFYSGVQPLPSNSVPTLSQWGLILLGLIVAVCGSVAVFRRKWVGVLEG